MTTERTAAESPAAGATERRALSTPGRVAVPLALAVVGAAVTGWNASVLIVG